MARLKSAEIAERYIQQIEDINASGVSEREGMPIRELTQISVSSGWPGEALP